MDDKKEKEKTPRKPEKRRKEKKPYTPPVLTEYGNIKDLTHGASSSAFNDRGRRWF